MTSNLSEANVPGYDDIVAVTKETTGIQGAKSFRKSVSVEKIGRIGREHKLPA